MCSTSDFTFTTPINTPTNCHLHVEPASATNSLIPRLEGEGKENAWYTLCMRSISYVWHHAHCTSAHAAPANFSESWPWRAVQVFQNVLSSSLKMSHLYHYYTMNATYLCGCQPVTEKDFALPFLIDSKWGFANTAVLCSWWALW